MGDHKGKPIRCKAAVCRGPEQPLVIEDVDVAPPGPFEVRLKIICTSVCHSDVTFWKMKDYPGVYPRIFGHEAVGMVESVGDSVDKVSEGDMVIPTFLGECRDCSHCRSTESNLCTVGYHFATTMPRDPQSTSRFSDTEGNPIYNLLNVSSFTEYTVIDAAFVVKVDGAMPPDKACLLSCGVTTGIGGVWKVAQVREGSTVAVFGLGAVGLAVAEGARLRGASRIIGVDLNPEKFELGKKFGLTDFVNPKDIGQDRTLKDVIVEMTDGGADYCFECVGHASLMKDAFLSSKSGWGKTVVLGVEMNSTPMTIDTVELLRGKTIVGSLFGGIKAKTDIPVLVKQYLDKELRLDDFITHEVGFRDVNKAFDLLLQGKSLRCIIWMDR